MFEGALRVELGIMHCKCVEVFGDVRVLCQHQLGDIADVLRLHHPHFLPHFLPLLSSYLFNT